MNVSREIALVSFGLRPIFTPRCRVTWFMVSQWRPAL